VNVVALCAALAVGVGAAATASIVVPPTPRLAPRVRPYTVAARSALGLPPDASVPPMATSTLPRLFGPPARAVVAWLSRPSHRNADAVLARLLHAARRDMTTEEFRVRQLGTATAWATGCGAATGFVTRMPVLTLVAAFAGATIGTTRPRRALERAVATRATQMRQELYTVNQLLAMHVRTGSGPMQAVQRVVGRGRGAVVDELGDVLRWTRHGTSEVDAFRRAADETPEPSAARTYQLFAVGIERGTDLGSALLALSTDIRDARREEVHKEAVRRRAAMLVPTIAILAPIMLLFIAAPLPSIVLGHG
jgi:Flp pilus assembly protein TadB